MNFKIGKTETFGDGAPMLGLATIVNVDQEKGIVTLKSSAPEADGVKHAENGSLHGCEMGGRPIRKRGYIRALKRSELWAVKQCQQLQMVSRLARDMLGFAPPKFKPGELLRPSDRSPCDAPHWRWTVVKVGKTAMYVLDPNFNIMLFEYPEYCNENFEVVEPDDFEAEECREAAAGKLDWKFEHWGPCP